MNKPIIMIQTKTIFVVGELLSFYTTQLNTQLVKVDEPLEITSHIANYNPDDGDWYSWSLSDSCCSYQYVIAVRSLAKIKNLIGSCFEELDFNGVSIYRRLGVASLGTNNVFDTYKLTDEDKSNQEIVFSKVSELLNLRMEVDFLNSELQLKNTPNKKGCFSELFQLPKLLS